LKDVSQHKACAVIGQSRSTQRRQGVKRSDEDALTKDIIELASRYGRYGYRRITALLRNKGWHVNHKRVMRIWRREGLKVPIKQPKRGRLGSMMDHVFGFVLVGNTMFGRMTLCMTEQKMAERFGCSP